MKKKSILLILFSFLIISCAIDEDNLSDSIASRPGTPINSGTIQIGNQIWMTKNLNVSKYRNGDVIPQVQNPNQWINLQTGAWCYYANQTANGIIYGKLYNGYAVIDPRGIAPEGWHVPTNSEITTLIDYLNIENCGGRMKSTRLWNSPNMGADNSSGFTALPAGMRWWVDGQFLYINESCYFWTSTAVSSDRLNYLGLYHDMGEVINSHYPMRYGFSVRCIKD